MTIALGDTAHAAGPLPGAGFVLGYGTNGFTDHPLDAALRVLESTGYGALALTLGHPHLDPFAEDADHRAALLRERLDELGWRVVVETGTRYLLDPYAKHRPTLVDEYAAARMRFLRRAIDLAVTLRADCVSLWSGVLPEGVGPEEGWRRLLPRMREIVAYAEASGVTLGVEPEPGMLIETVDDALRLREELGSPDVLGITVDLGHCVLVEPEGVVGALRAAGPLLVNVQVDDMMPDAHEHLELGRGRLDLAAALATLHEIGFHGVAAMELPRHAHDAPRVAARSMRAIHDAWRER
ncbi:sugar phosphate isomerase/epimerase family protein [Agromyces ramosus]|uniref:Sugar phosphate isomerase/epimerase n=1 Tax=Agromyces ramosus TaxID=33879 RepID=A0ABU0R868_9MICO|nr:sugar phosphate isomerase/epimerase family protein [Agromyces ramosus]MDQ0894233.1 sugar phosphate isomerase/epimerase [Agromyces ramosus]